MGRGVCKGGGKVVVEDWRGACGGREVRFSREWGGERGSGGATQAGRWVRHGGRFCGTRGGSGEKKGRVRTRRGKGTLERIETKGSEGGDLSKK